MGRNEFEKIKRQDWTQRELRRPEAKQFANEVVWPAIDLLHTVDIHGEYFSEEDITKFVNIENLAEDEEVFRNPPPLETSNGLQLASIELLAYCTDEALDPDIVYPVGVVDIDLWIRLLDDEKRLLGEDSELQIWQNKAYFINGGRLHQPISLDITFTFRDSNGKTVQELSKPLRRILKKLEETLEVEYDNYTTKREHCLDIAASLVMVGVPEDFIDEKMYGFNQTEDV